MKVQDDTAQDGEEITDIQTASVASGRTLEDIAAEKPRGKQQSAKRAKTRAKPRGANVSPPALVEPQLARLAERVPAGDKWIHEIKYDG